MNARLALRLRRARGLAAALALALSATPALGQQPEASQPTPEASSDAPVNPYGTGAGLEILLTNSGFGFGAYHNRALGSATSTMVEVSFGAGKDAREVRFFSFTGRSVIQEKANYLLMLPIQGGIQRRLFRQTIEDNFRPYLQLTGGPTLGWVYPYFEDLNGNGQLDTGQLDTDGDGAPDSAERTYDAFSSLHKGHMRLGLGGTIALGAHFGFSKKLTQGVRIGYTFAYFFEPVQLLEPDVQDAQHYFGSPVISLTFGRLY